MFISPSSTSYLKKKKKNREGLKISIEDKKSTRGGNNLFILPSCIFIPPSLLRWILSVASIHVLIFSRIFDMGERDILSQRLNNVELLKTAAPQCVVVCRPSFYESDGRQNEITAGIFITPARFRL